MARDSKGNKQPKGLMKIPSTTSFSKKTEPKQPVKLMNSTTTQKLDIPPIKAEDVKAMVPEYLQLRQFKLHDLLRSMESPFSLYADKWNYMDAAIIAAAEAERARQIGMQSKQEGIEIQVQPDELEFRLEDDGDYEIYRQSEESIGWLVQLHVKGPWEFLSRSSGCQYTTSELDQILCKLDELNAPAETEQEDLGPVQLDHPVITGPGRYACRAYEKRPTKFNVAHIVEDAGSMGWKGYSEWGGDPFMMFWFSDGTPNEKQNGVTHNDWIITRRLSDAESETKKAALA